MKKIWVDNAQKLDFENFGSAWKRCLFVTCVGIASVRLGGPSIHNKGETMSKRPPLLGTTGKLALAGKRNRAHQLLDCKQHERDRPWTQIVSPWIPMSLLQAPVVRGRARCSRIP